MESSFADARDAVFAVQAAWDTLLPSIVRAARELDQLRATAQALDRNSVRYCTRHLEIARLRKPPKNAKGK